MEDGFAFAPLRQIRRPMMLLAGLIAFRSTLFVCCRPTTVVACHEESCDGDSVISYIVVIVSGVSNRVENQSCCWNGHFTSSTPKRASRSWWVITICATLSRCLRYKKTAAWVVAGAEAATNVLEEEVGSETGFPPALSWKIGRQACAHLIYSTPCRDSSGARWTMLLASSCLTRARSSLIGRASVNDGSMLGGNEPGRRAAHAA